MVLIYYVVFNQKLIAMEYLCVLLGEGVCRGPPKNSAHRSGCQMPQGRRYRCAIALAMDKGVWPPPDWEWGNALQGASGRPGEGACRGPPKNSARKSGCQRPQGRRDGWAIALVGRRVVASTGLRMWKGFARHLGAPKGGCVLRPAQK